MDEPTPFDDLLQKARKKIANGADPEVVMDEFMRTGVNRILHPIIKAIKDKPKTDHSSDG